MNEEIIKEYSVIEEFEKEYELLELDSELNIIVDEEIELRK
jgi:hypothetical protein